MNAYVDYEFYAEQYNGSADEKVFKELALSATQYIRYLTMNKSDGYSGEELKYATCEVISIYYENKYKSVGKEIKSENNDGYAVTFVVEGKDGETAEERVNRKACQAVRKWLLPTGLLNRKVGCVHDY